MFKLEFETDNDAFSENDSGTAEIALLLAQVAREVQFGLGEGVIIDTNGNKVGAWHSTKS